ncbi:MAG: hypothetical protein CMO01_00300 [Thalassobius sp.]|nr:hypothetical protein [Thalassovita sp.]
MKIYAISGLGADERVFKFLKLDCELIPLHWIAPQKNESIESYALRLSKNIDSKHKSIGIIGVSFGGLVATEITKIINPKFTILISSAETKDELRSIYRLIGKTNFVKLIPSSFFQLPAFLQPILFGTSNSKLLNQIIADTDLKFTKWAISQLVSWKNKERLKNCLKISGTKDLLLPHSSYGNVELIKDGAHFMIVDRATEISEIINQYILNSFKL